MSRNNELSEDSKLVYPYKIIKQHTRISLEPYYMNSDIKTNMKNVLKKKVEKKCNKNGFVDEVLKIFDYQDGLLVPENLNGAAIFNISYQSKICIPIENTIIISYIKLINNDLIVSINGPLFIFIEKKNVDNNIWDIPEGYLNKKSNKKLEVGHYVKTQIINKRINQNDSLIKIIGRLLDFATDDEVEKYFGSKITKTENVDTMTENEESNYII